MSGLKNKIPKPFKRLYHRARNEVLSSDRVFNMLYGDNLTVSDDEVILKFDTSSMIAKRWFYPRYNDGSMHEPVVSRALRNQLNSNSVFFDVGANVGFYTVLGSEICSEVHAFEMDPRLTGIISSHFDKREHTASDIHIVPAAVGNTGGDFVTFTPHQTGNPSTNAIDAEQSELPESPTFQIQTVALGDYIKKTGVQPDMLKIDVEGFELSVLKGISTELDDIHTLLIELHPTLLDQYGSNTNEVLQLIDDYGFNTKRFTDHRATMSPEESLEPITTDTVFTENGMILCTK